MHVLIIGNLVAICLHQLTRVLLEVVKLNSVRGDYDEVDDRIGHVYKKETEDRA